MNQTTRTDQRLRWTKLLVILFSLTVHPLFAQQPESNADSNQQPSDSQEQQDSRPGDADAARQRGEDWPLFRGDRNATGVANTKLPDQLEELWQFKVPRGGFEGSPIIVQNQSDKKKTVYLPGMNGKLFSVDLASGQKNWDYDTGLGFTASPAYHQGRIFIGDIDGIFWCFNESGEVQWKFESMAEITGSANFFEDGVLFGSQDANLYMLKQETGEKIWVFETSDQIRCSATIAGGQGFVAGCDAYLHLIDLKEGKEISKVDIQSPTGSTPAVSNGVAMFGTENADFFAIQLKSPGVDWRFVDEQGQAAVRGSAAINDQHVIFGARNRQVYSLDPKTGNKQWSSTLRAKVDGSPVIVGDQVIIGSTDGRLYSLSLTDGKQRWERQLNGGILGSPAVAFGKLVVATDRGVVYCLGSEK